MGENLHKFHDFAATREKLIHKILGMPHPLRDYEISLTFRKMLPSYQSTKVSCYTVPAGQRGHCCHKAKTKKLMRKNVQEKQGITGFFGVFSKRGFCQRAFIQEIWFFFLFRWW